MKAQGPFLLDNSSGFKEQPPHFGHSFALFGAGVLTLSRKLRFFENMIWNTLAI